MTEGRRSSIEQLKLSYWNEQSTLMNILYNDKLQEYLASQPYLENAFGLSERPFVCIDEGIPVSGISITASGLLLGLDKAFSLAQKAQVTEVTAHDGCGGAKKYAVEHGLDPSAALLTSSMFSQELAKRLRVPYRLITTHQMTRPPEFHIARIGIVDATGEMNAQINSIFPRAFKVSRAYLEPEDGIQDIRIATDIALHGSGFGNLATPDSPFVIVAIGNPDRPELSKETIMNELEPLKREFNDRVKIIGFTAPSKNLQS